MKKMKKQDEDDEEAEAEEEQKQTSKQNNSTWFQFLFVPFFKICWLQTIFWRCTSEASIQSLSSNQ